MFIGIAVNIHRPTPVAGGGSGGAGDHYQQQLNTDHYQTEDGTGAYLLE
jgi:hypothetical protein